jgi:hypothetical protein
MFIELIRFQPLAHLWAAEHRAATERPTISSYAMISCGTKHVGPWGLGPFIAAEAPPSRVELSYDGPADLDDQSH